LNPQLVDLVMTECRQLRRYFTSKMYNLYNLKIIHNLNKVSATYAVSAHSNDAQSKRYYYSRYNSPIPKTYYKSWGLASEKCFFTINSQSITTLSGAPVSRSHSCQRLSLTRNYSSLLMGLISTKCDRHSQCACCSDKISNCRCNCEKSTRCFCAGPRHYHRIGVTHHNRWFSTGNHKMSNKELKGIDLLREPNVNKVCLIIFILFSNLYCKHNLFCINSMIFLIEFSVFLYYFGLLYVKLTFIS
jgi:hypothetical protein